MSEQWRTALNNYLEQLGTGTQALTWKDVRQMSAPGAPWISTSYYMNAKCASGSGPTKSAAREEAARQTLQMMSPGRYSEIQRSM